MSRIDDDAANGVLRLERGSSRGTPSPLMGEGWDGGPRFGNGILPPTFILPHKEGFETARGGQASFEPVVWKKSGEAKKLTGTQNPSSPLTVG